MRQPRAMVLKRFISGTEWPPDRNVHSVLHECSLNVAHSAKQACANGQWDVLDLEASVQRTDFGQHGWRICSGCAECNAMPPGNGGDGRVSIPGTSSDPL